jgi:hypothetical protein
MAGYVLLAIIAFLLALALFLLLPVKRPGSHHAALLTPQSTVTFVDKIESR